MTKKLLNKLKSQHLSVSLPLAQGVGFFKLSNFVLETSQTEFNIFELFAKWGMSLLSTLVYILYSWIFLICKWTFNIIDVFQVFVNKLIGLGGADASLNSMIYDNPLFAFIINDTVIKVFIALVGLGLVLIIVFSIIAIIKSEYEFATDQADVQQEKNTTSKVLKKSMTSLFLMLFTPLILFVSIVFSTAILNGVNNALSQSNYNVTMGGQIFSASSYDANRYRIYANNNQRIPILFDFEDPYSAGTYKNYTSEHLASIYKSWEDTGKKNYLMFQDNSFGSFASTITYKNNTLYNKYTTYGGYERFVSTAEQYYAMADFMDFAVTTGLTYYIKNMLDEDIFWDEKSVNGATISDGVYNPEEQSLYISYNDKSDIVMYADFYNVLYKSGLMDVSSPIVDTIETISQILGIAGNNDAVVFKMLERMEGSQNIVKWQTEMVYNSYNGEFPVYKLQKRYKNLSTQHIETYAEVLVAQKQVGGDFFIVTAPANSTDKYYEYTTLQMDYIQSDDMYPDIIEPLYKYGTWPEKLYNDLKVIFKDINIDNYINYGTWADALGSYFNGGAVTSSQVATFSTSLIHPLGLIMSELFLGDLQFGDDITMSSEEYNFGSLYMEETLNSILKTVGTQYNYKNLKGQIDYFIELYNSIMKPVLDDISYYESFNLVSETPLDVYSYVYRAYLASIMLGEDFSNYMYSMATLGTQMDELINNIVYNSSSGFLDSNGQPLTQSRKIVDLEGEFITNYYRNSNGDIISRMVYGRDGNLYPTINANGVLDVNGKFIIDPDDIYRTIKIENNTYFYEIGDNPPVRFYEQGDGVVLVYNHMGILVPATTEEGEQIVSVFAIDEYFTYESEEIAIVSTNYTPYNQLNAYNQALVDEVYNYLLDSESSENPEIYYEYVRLVQSYKNPSAAMDAILNTRTPNEREFSRISKNLERIKENIENYENIINNPLTLPRAKTRAAVKKDALQEQVRMYEKALLIQAFRSYTAERMSSDLTIVVNGKSYNINIYTGSTKFYEFVLGNKLINTELLGSLSNQQSYSALTEYDKITIKNIDSRIGVYYNQMNSIGEKLGGMKKGVGFVSTLLMSESELSILNSIASVFNNGLYYGFTNYSLILNKSERDIASDAIDKFKATFDTDNGYNRVFNNYINGVTLSPEDYNFLQAMVQEYTTEKSLHYIDPEYNGLIDSDNNTWGILKEFLKEFGDLCFDLNNKSNLTSLVPYANDSQDINDYIDSLIRTVQTQLYGFDKLEFVNSYSSINGKTFNNLANNTQDAFRKIYNFYESEYIDNSTEFNLIARNTFSNILSNNITVNFDNIKKYIDNYLQKMTDEGLDPIGISDFRYYETTWYPSMTSEYQQYILTLVSITESKISKYNTLVSDYKNSQDSLKNYLNNRFPMTSSSLIYTNLIPEYLRYFERNNQPDEDLFVEDEYTYFGIDNYPDALAFYNSYLAAYNDVDFGANGITYNQLNDMQRLVLRNDDNTESEWSLEEYLYGTKNSYAVSLKEWQSTSENENDSVIQKIKSNHELLIDFVSGKTNLSLEIMGIISDNIDLINTYRVFDYMGLEYAPDYTLKDYRIQAMNNLIDFEEYIGESGASLQRRYLANLYLFISDYELAANNIVYIREHQSTKSTIFRLAGISNRPDETIVGLEYEVNFHDSRSDEQFGSTFIICTYDEENGRYAPFLFATRKNPENIPFSDAYYSPTGEIRYYPVIAKGIFDTNGRPTAIREVNGFIEFYRDDITVVSASTLNIESYYESSENVSVSFNPIATVVNAISKLITKKTIAENINSLFPKFDIDANISYPFGVEKSTIYYVDGGRVDMNYNFSTTKAIGFNYLYDIKHINILVMLLGTVIFLTVLTKAIWGLISRLFKMVVLFIISPPIIASVTINDDKFGYWREETVSSILSVFGYVVAINLFFIIIPITNGIEVFTADSVARLQTTWMFKNSSVAGLNGIAQTIFLFVGFLLIESAPRIISGIIGGDEVLKMGEDTLDSVKSDIKKVQDHVSGYAAMDTVTRFKNNAKSFIPLYETGRKVAGKATGAVRSLKDKKRGKNIEKELLDAGVSADKAEKAAQAYIESKNKIRENKAEAKKDAATRFDKREKARGDIVEGEDKRMEGRRKIREAEHKRREKARKK